MTKARLRTGIFAAAALAGLMLASTALPARAADKSAWLKAVAATIAKKQTYPRSALAREIEGTAKVKIVVDRSGRIASYEIIQPTGEEVLDRELERLIARIDPLPAPPAGASDGDLTLVVPIVWSLR